MANARELTLKALYRMETEGAYSNQELKHLLASKELPEADRGFVTELLLGVVRNKLFLDYVIGQFSSVKLKKLSPWIHGILRLGVYQILCMDRVPDSAACNEMVKLAGKYSRGASRGFVNGVLRNVSRNQETIAYPREPIANWSVRYSCPEWLTLKLKTQYGDETEEILKASLMPYPVSIRANTMKLSAKELQDVLAQEGIKTRLNPEHDRCLYVEGALDVNRSKAYRDGLYTLQNTSSMKAVELLDPQKGETLLDVCAAPGGKTTYMGELLGDTGEVIACDLHPHKIPLLEAAASRLGLANVKAMCRDATEFCPAWEQAFDRVLADVPCSGIGVIHKKPEIKWNRKEADIATLVEIQRQILNTAARYVKNGGILVYSTCTILQEENQEQIKAFLQDHTEFTLLEELQLLTHKTGGSGFYIAKLRKQV